MISYGHKTDAGMRRENNEDACLCMPEHGVFAVADGVGGHAFGEEASALTVEAIRFFVTDNPLSRIGRVEGVHRENWHTDYFNECVRCANDEVLDAAGREDGHRGMASTLALAYVDGFSNSVYIVNLGDSRVYLIRDGAITRLTEDHTYAENLVAAGVISKREAKKNPKKNVIVKGIGLVRDIEPDFFRYELRADDTLILCSDGLHGELSAAEIKDIALSAGDPQEACERLVAAANEKGGRDNITVIAVRLGRYSAA